MTRQLYALLLIVLEGVHFSSNRFHSADLDDCEEYFQWLDRAERTGSEFLKGEISEEEASEAICV